MDTSRSWTAALLLLLLFLLRASRLDSRTPPDSFFLLRNTMGCLESQEHPVAFPFLLRELSCIRCTDKADPDFHRLHFHTSLRTTRRRIPLRLPLRTSTLRVRGRVPDQISVLSESVRFHFIYLCNRFCFSKTQKHPTVSTPLTSRLRGTTTRRSPSQGSMTKQ